eukprot:UN08144
MSKSNKRSRNSFDLEDTCNISKRRRIARPQLHFANSISKSAKYSYHSTFKIIKPKLIFPDDIIEIILNYFHIYDLYKVRQDPYFKAITDIKINRNPSYLHKIFIASTDIPDLCVLFKYDSSWCSQSLIPKLNLTYSVNCKLRQYFRDSGTNSIDDNSEDVKLLKISSKIQNIKQDMLELIILKLFVEDKTTHTLVHHLQNIGLCQLEMYHKPRLL